MVTPIADMPAWWQCKCGARSFNTHEFCDRCGEPKPEAPKQAEPREEPMLDVGLRDDKWWFQRARGSGL